MVSNIAAVGRFGQMKEIIAKSILSAKSTVNIDEKHISFVAEYINQELKN